MMNYINHNNFIFFIGKIFKILNAIFFPILVVSLTFALIISPPDYLQGEAVRIMYVHVPAAWIALACYSVMLISSLGNYIFKIKNLFIINKSLAPIGLLFTSLAVITGSIWGRPTWGTWLALDARLISMLVLMFFYLLFIFITKFIENESTSNRLSSYTIILGSINLPIIKFSVDWWNTLHQTSSINVIGKVTIDKSMLLPLSLMLLAFLIYCAMIFLMKFKTEIIKIKKKNLNRL